jgi:hypothetical protein
MPGHGDGRQNVKKHYDDLDGIFVLSEWHKNFFAKWHDVPKDKLIITGNGIDIERFTCAESLGLSQIEASSIVS